MHVTTSYVASKLMKNCSRGHILQSYIARLLYIHVSLMALNRTLVWEVLRAFSLMEMSHPVEVTCLRNLEEYYVSWRCPMWKKQKI